MGNLIVASDFQEYTTTQLSSNGADSDYPDDNVLDYWDLYRHFRTTSAFTDDWLLKIDFGSATELAAIILNDVNFDTVKIEYSTDDITYNDAGSGNLTVSKDIVVQRYKIYAALSSFNYRYLRVYIPSGTADVESLGAWRVGTLVCLADDTAKVITLTKNMSYGYTVGSAKATRDVPKYAGGQYRFAAGDKLIWTCEARFNVRRSSEFDELWKINALGSEQPVIFYENRDDTSKVYLCTRDSDFRMTETFNNVVRGQAVRFTELV